MKGNIYKKNPKTGKIEKTAPDGTITVFDTFEDAFSHTKRTQAESLPLPVSLTREESDYLDVQEEVKRLRFSPFLPDEPHGYEKGAIAIHRRTEADDMRDWDPAVMNRPAKM